MQATFVYDGKIFYRSVKIQQKLVFICRAFRRLSQAHSTELQCCKWPVARWPNATRIVFGPPKFVI